MDIPAVMAHQMFARINFLLGLGLLILTAFYFAGAYLVVLPLSTIAPDWVKPAAGVAILAASGITVQLLSIAMGELRGIALYAKGERPGMLVVISQGAIILGHIGALYLASGLIVGGKPMAEMQVLAIAAFYVVGVAVAIHEWRQRKLART